MTTDLRDLNNEEKIILGTLKKGLQNKMTDTEFDRQSYFITAFDPSIPAIEALVIDDDNSWENKPNNFHRKFYRSVAELNDNGDVEVKFLWCDPACSWTITHRID